MGTFETMAKRAGLPERGGYSLREVSAASGISVTTLGYEVRAGRLGAFVPSGRKRGYVVTPERFDAWWESGMWEARPHGAREVRSCEAREECEGSKA